jgi:hypothetical protein
LEIEKAVEIADTVIVCLSSNSVTKEGYIQKDNLKMYFCTRYDLFFGRRSEFSANQTMIAKRSKLFSLFEKNNIQIMTFDRLSDLLLQSPSLYRSSRQSVCSYVNGKFIWKSDIYKK